MADSKREEASEEITLIYRYLHAVSARMREGKAQQGEIDTYTYELKRAIDKLSTIAKEVTKE